MLITDLKKVFDRVKFKDVMHLHYNREEPNQLTKLVKNIHEGNRIKIEI